jgi:pyridoxine/pyridoxamine 5'-phosphate oxidase
VHRRPGLTPAGASRRARDAWDDAVPSGDTPPSGTATVTRPVHGEPSVTDRLVELDELRRRGIVTEAEFASKKAELLDRL